MSVVQTLSYVAMIFLKFFQEKSENLFRLKFTFSRFDAGLIVKFGSFHLLKERQNPQTNSQIVNVTKKGIDFEFRKWN